MIVDDHLALVRLGGGLPELDAVGPVVTTSSFHFRLARAVADSVRSGSLSRRLTEPPAALRRILRPPAHRLLVLDPRSSIEKSVEVAVRHGANLLLAELAGAALYHGAAVRVVPANVGRSWARVMADEGIDFAPLAGGEASAGPGGGASAAPG